MKKYFLPGFLICILFIFLCLKLSLSFTRQFDPDEFAYLHWSYLLFTGKLPYRDFFFYITPLFPAFLTPIFLFPWGATTAILGRVAMIWIYIGTLATLFFLTKKITKNTITSLLTLMIFTAFPMTFDKTIEIRPDMVMTLLFFISVIFLEQKRIILSGACLLLSFLFLPKIIFAIPAFVYLFYTSPNHTLRTIWRLALGGIFPAILLVAWLSKNSLLTSFFSALTYDATIVNVSSASFSPLTAFSPWPLAYVNAGSLSIPWIIGTLLWIFSIPGLFFLWKLQKRWGIFFSILTLGAILFLFVFPKPFLQYFIVPSFVASIASAIAIQKACVLVQKTFHTSYLFLLCTITFLFLVSFGIQYKERQIPERLAFEQLGVLSDIEKISNPNESVYDMVGSFIFRPDSYYICCHQYNEFANHLKKPLPPLRDSLIVTKTKFLVMDQKGYVFWLPASSDLSFLLTHYLPTQYKKIYSLGSSFVCEKGSCIQYTLHDAPVNAIPTTNINIPIEEYYRITLTPPDTTISINNKIYRNGDHDFFTKDTYLFIPSFSLTKVVIQLSR